MKDFIDKVIYDKLNNIDSKYIKVFGILEFIFSDVCLDEIDKVDIKYCSYSDFLFPTYYISSKIYLEIAMLCKEYDFSDISTIIETYLEKCKNISISVERNTEHEGEYVKMVKKYSRKYNKEKRIFIHNRIDGYKIIVIDETISGEIPFNINILANYLRHKENTYRFYIGDLENREKYEY